MLVYEQEVLNLVARGLTDAQIAYSMQVRLHRPPLCASSPQACASGAVETCPLICRCCDSPLWRQITQAGVRNALTKLMTSFKADTRCELVRIALDNDLITE